jgi:GTP-binding protein HflX
MDIEDIKIGEGVKACLVSIVCDKFENHRTKADTERSLDELGELLRTLGVEHDGRFIQNKKTIEAGTFLGVGKLEEIATEARIRGCEALVFDFELSASQVRNIQKITELDIFDRVYIILEIFAKHARTSDAKIQIEISRLQYILPRLTSMWSHFSKQKGGIGLKGEGEQQLELDRRIIRDKIEKFKKQLKEIKKSRKEQMKKRQNKAVTAALVGYTNAGKSSLMNRMCKVDVLEEDKLFATLDSTFRTLNPDTKPPMILIDTVGFISNLPSTLIQGFKTTLESAIEADLLIHVVDISDPHYEKHIEVTLEVLKELNITDKEMILVFNKKDKLKNPFDHKIKMRNFKDSFVVSSFNDDDIRNLREYVVNYFLAKQNNYDLFVPYTEGTAHSKILGNCNITKQKHLNTGTFYRIRIPEFIFGQLALKSFILGPEESKKLLQ